MPRNSFVQMSKLHNVRGRIYYISSDKKQENLYAVYETTDRKFWTELAKCNQAEFKKSGTEGKCIEAREFIIAEISFGVYLTVMIIKTLSFKLQFPIRRSMGTKSHIPIRHLNIGICSILKNGMDI